MPGPQDLLQCALAHHRAGRHAEAEAAYRDILAQAPDLPDALHFLGLLLFQTNQRTEGLELMRRAVAAGPDVAAYHFNLGKALREIRRLDESIDSLTRATQLNPNLTDAWQELGTSLRSQGRLDEAMAAFARGVSLGSTLACGSALLMTMWFHPRLTPQQVFAHHRAWAQRFADPLGAAVKPGDFANVKDPARRLRIGYVSADLWDHVLGRYIAPVFAHHDREQFEVYCYSGSTHEDDVSAKIRAGSSHWRATAGMPDDRLAALIRQDRIDVLIDLAAHMGASRLLTFARRPAPVQATYLAYPATTGLLAMDYRITDPYLDPPGLTESIHSEKLARLPSTYWCYPVPADAPGVGELPARAAGYVTFGALNGPTKLNPETIQLWARVLQATRNARLRLQLPGSPANNRSVPLMLEQNGIDPARVDFEEFQSQSNYLRLYQKVDLSLDPWPYNGHTTSLDSLFMGVPVVTLEGAWPVARAGVSFLSNLGLRDQLVAHSPEQYVQIAVDLARDTGRLSALRADLRPRMMNSPLVDAVALTRGLEQSYRRMWSLWCDGRPPEAFSL